MEWYFILFASDGISCTSKNPLNIRFTESALEEGSEEEKELRKNVKQVLEVIVGLLKDRVDVEKEPSNGLSSGISKNKSKALRMYISIDVTDHVCVSRA